MAVAKVVVNITGTVEYPWIQGSVREHMKTQVAMKDVVTPLSAAL